MPKLTLILVLHNHQPVGNLPEVFRQAFDSAYLPFMGLLERHPSFRCGLHYTGPLLEWLEAEEPRFLSRVATLQTRGQVELLGGALYEPILAVIPDADKAGQLKTMSDRLEKRFGARPSGAWLAERVWEPHLPRYLSRASLSYTILDQEHFEKAGLPSGQIDGAWLTEDVGYTVSLLPASTDLRYLIPWRPVEEAIAFLRHQHEAGRDLMVFADDGEKLGAWPGTHRLCYEEGWLERFLEAVEQNQDWLQLDTPADYLAAVPQRRRIYIPSASYPEMEDWSLTPAIQQRVRRARDQADGAAARFVRLGHWRGFLTRYSEANLMLQRGITISRRVHALPPGPGKEAALDHLWRGQCNCPYWHGVFGGIYLYHIRHAVFSHLVAADAIADPVGPSEVALRHEDYDADGLAEWCLSSTEQAAFVHPLGGHLFEWDLRTGPINLLNTLAPYRESYSSPGGEESDYDAVPLRRAFVDHFVAEPQTLAQVIEEAWADSSHLTRRPFRLEGLTQGSRGQVIARHEGLMAVAGHESEISVEKAYAVSAGERCLRVTYSLAGHQGLSAPLFLATEVSLALPPGAHTSGKVSTSGEASSLTDPADLGVVDGLKLCAGPGRLVVDLDLGPAAHVLVHPLFSQHRTELGAEQVYQGTRIVLMWPLAEGDQERWRAAVTLSWRA
ncbi:MAG: DUF1925 domain-containing protein [Anaerolineae bacterium]|nr:DUF1925 domain-containing protein [Anaerolineae bacterium]